MILPIHILGVTFSLLVVAFADHYGLSWIKGEVSVLNEKKLRKLHRYTWLGLLAIITTGGIMFLGEPDELLSSKIFLLKMTFVSALIVNSFFIGVLKEISANSKFSDLSRKEKIKLYISGGVSTISWLGALTCAFFI